MWRPGTALDYLAIAGAVFVLPFLLFSGYSGHLSDRISKRSVMISVKVFEIGVMGLGLAVFFTDSLKWMLLVLFLMARALHDFQPGQVWHRAGDARRTRIFPARTACWK